MNCMRSDTCPGRALTKRRSRCGELANLGDVPTGWLHSAGAQYLVLLAAFVPHEAKRIVIANAGAQVFPSVELNACPRWIWQGLCGRRGGKGLATFPSPATDVHARRSGYGRERPSGRAGRKITGQVEARAWAECVQGWQKA